jgi:hypothetical protein
MVDLMDECISRKWAHCSSELWGERFVVFWSGKAAAKHHKSPSKTPHLLLIWTRLPTKLKYTPDGLLYCMFVLPVGYIDRYYICTLYFVLLDLTPEAFLNDNYLELISKVRFRQLDRFQFNFIEGYTISIRKEAT